MKKKAIVLDVDGVILNTAFLFEEIYSLKLKGDAMWDYFHKNCNSEKVNLIEGFYLLYLKLLDMKINSDVELILLTSRNEKVREATEKKLKGEGIFFDRLYMRLDGDNREANILKKETLQDLQKEYNILLYIDDDLKNCEAGKELGIYTLRKV